MLNLINRSLFTLQNVGHVNLVLKIIIMCLRSRKENKFWLNMYKSVQVSWIFPSYFLQEYSFFIILILASFICLSLIAYNDSLCVNIWFETYLFLARAACHPPCITGRAGNWAIVGWRWAWVWKAFDAKFHLQNVYQHCSQVLWDKRGMVSLLRKKSGWSEIRCFARATVLLTCVVRK